MTIPNPTPTTREREAARDISQDIYNTTSQSQRNDEYDKYQRKAFDNLVVPLIAAALARERREAMTEAAQFVRTHDTGFSNGRMVVCERQSDGTTPGDLYAAAIEALREGSE